MENLTSNLESILLKSPAAEVAGYLTGQSEGRIWSSHLHYLNSGSTFRVEFEWSTVIHREEEFGDVIGFFHTHPFGLERPSRRDVKTMRAWCDCLGKELLCIIGIPGPKDIDLYGYLFRNFRSLGRKMHLISQIGNVMTFKE